MILPPLQRVYFIVDTVWIRIFNSGICLCECPIEIYIYIYIYIYSLSVCECVHSQTLKNRHIWMRVHGYMYMHASTHTPTHTQRRA